ncbi:hypothetical protein [Streptomyces violascens]|uniref:C2H2-type domain-containing protein n=1 Tax=Streptomyces violascens TaxID=67381 RepID=A0ABQ3QM35_9ACTN|nr:hypothetical protein [Streptomyces violascens]GGT98717.1 hypothetical protein GCM10010289_18870 [Streptomyces violascens]GHI38331.1 hypothetical protein Sviol_27390 [Streptomyces violascens]
MSEIAETTAHEAYAFACMRCGYGWEQAYEIEHHTDATGQAFVIYKANGERVPSPLSAPTCLNCGGHVVRIMRAGRVSSAQQGMVQYRAPAPTQPAPQDEADATAKPEHHWHLSDLLHPFHRK